VVIDADDRRVDPACVHFAAMGRPLRIGIQLPEVEREVRWPEVAAMARLAEDVGLDSVWVGDHYLYRNDGRPERGPWEAWTQLAAIGAITSRVTIGPLVACLNFHAPGPIAKTIATVDEVSGGRLVVGVGAGWNRTEFDAFGVPFDHRVDRFEESLPIVRRLLDGERVTFRGRYVEVDDAVLLPAPARRAPIMLGSSGPRMLRVGLPHADAWNIWWEDFGNAPEGFAQASAAVDEAARAVRVDPSSIERSACALVAFDHGSDERRVPDGIAAVDGSREALPGALEAFADAGADEVIVVAIPIDEAAIRALGDAAAALDRA
jgi:alkanesulfonate monooxygenase SsuD/methylene tetrahydromethanopterin reductase-like flavin-dependent oxidoreductase (luciferase family)